MHLQICCGLKSEGTMIEIEAVGNSDATRKAAIEAARIQAKICLGGCEHCIKVRSRAPVKAAAGPTNIKIQPEACCVRTVCALLPDMVRPPKNAKKHEDCPIRQRAERKAAGVTTHTKAA
jgi:hypothetical protein